MSSYHGKFVWYDLMTSDLKQAASFYSGVIGWDAKDAGMAGPPYTIFSMGPTMVAGLMTIPDEARAMGAPPSWSGYIAVDDVDAYAARVKAASGAIHRPPEDIPGIGRFAVAADPHGAVFILFKGASDQGPAAVAPGTPGRIGWHELHAGDAASAFAFYAGLFGWTKAEAMDMGPMGIYQTFDAGGVPCGGMMTKTATTPHPFWLYYFNVGDIDEAAKRATDRGGKILHGPMEVPGGQWVVQCADPQGAAFAMLGTHR